MLKGGGAIAVLALVSLVLTFTGKDTVSSADAAGALTIRMNNTKFGPDVVSVGKGTTTKLLVKNSDPYAHSFVVDGYDISETFGPGESRIISFTPKGDGPIPFKCDIHESMKGSIHVLSAAW